MMHLDAHGLIFFRYEAIKTSRGFDPLPTCNPSRVASSGGPGQIKHDRSAQALSYLSLNRLACIKNTLLPGSSMFPGAIAAQAGCWIVPESVIADVGATDPGC